jgi:hypothetical protein
MHQVGKGRLAGVCQFVVHRLDFSYSIGALSRGLFADLRASLGERRDDLRACLGGLRADLGAAPFLRFEERTEAGITTKNIQR